jgi:5-methylcytosine-specific restriction enzyme A
MTWTGDPRTSTTSWRRQRARILQRDHHICHVCGQPGADEVDHIVPISQGGTNHDTNLAAIHNTPCHRRKSSSEGTQARWNPRRHRPAEPHPGLKHRGGG